MPPKRDAMKRPASVVSKGRPPKSRKSQSPEEAALLEKCDAIADAVKCCGLPEHVGQALSASVGSCLKTYKADRHPFQSQMLEMVGEALSSSKATQKLALENAQAKISGFDTAKEARQEELTNAEKKHSEATALVAERKAAHSADAEALKKAVADRKAAVATQKAADKSFEEQSTKKSKLEAAFAAEDGFGALKEKAGTASAVKQFTKACQECGFDKSLLEAVPPVLTAAPENRGTFGSLIVEQLQSQYDKVLAELTASQSEMETTQSENAKAVETADSVMKMAMEKDEASKKALDEAVAEQTQATQSITAAQKTIKGALPELEQAKRDVAAATDALNKLEGGALAFFTELLEHAPPPAPVEEETAVETTEDVKELPEEEVTAEAA